MNLNNYLFFILSITNKDNFASDRSNSILDSGDIYPQFGKM